MLPLPPQPWTVARPSAPVAPRCRGWQPARRAIVMRSMDDSVGTRTEANGVEFPLDTMADMTSNPYEGPKGSSHANGQASGHGGEAGSSKSTREGAHAPKIKVSAPRLRTHPVDLLLARAFAPGSRSNRSGTSDVLIISLLWGRRGRVSLPLTRAACMLSVSTQHTRASRLGHKGPVVCPRIALLRKLYTPCDRAHTTSRLATPRETRALATLCHPAPRQGIRAVERPCDSRRIEILFASQVRRVPNPLKNAPVPAQARTAVPARRSTDDPSPALTDRARSSSAMRIAQAEASAQRAEVLDLRRELAASQQMVLEARREAKEARAEAATLRRKVKDKEEQVATLEDSLRVHKDQLALARQEVAAAREDIKASNKYLVDALIQLEQGAADRNRCVATPRCPSALCHAPLPSSPWFCPGSGPTSPPLV